MTDQKSRIEPSNQSRMFAISGNVTGGASELVQRAAVNYLQGLGAAQIKRQCVQLHCFETIQRASRVVGDWIRFYNNRRPNQALGMKTPAEVFALAA